MITITASDFKDYFDRDFTFGGCLPDVRDKDVEKAISEAGAFFNHELYGSDESAERIALLNLTAHYLQNDLDGADGGGQSKFVQSSRSVGSVSESVALPGGTTEGSLSYFQNTSYGQKYLSITEPFLVGVVFSVEGGTRA